MTIRRGVIETVEDLESLVLGDVVTLNDRKNVLPPIQVAIQNDTGQWVLAGQKATWTPRGLFETAQMEKLNIHLMRRA